MSQTPPAPPIPAPAPPTATARPTHGQRVALASGLALGVLGAALPAMAALYALSLSLGVLAWSEVLQHTGGLEPSTFGGGLWTSAAANGGVLLWCALRRLRSGRTPDSADLRPLGALIGLYAAGIALVVLDLTRAADVPDVLTTFVVLGWAELWTALVPIVGLYLLGIGVAALWRAGAGSPGGARRVTGLAGALGAGGALLTAALLAGASLGYEDQGGEPAPLTVPGVEGARQVAAEIAAGLVAPRLPEPDAGPADAFQECAEELARAVDRNGRKTLDNTRALLVRDGLDLADAEDVTMRTLLKICEKYRHKQPRIRYFVKAARRNGWKLQQRQRREPVWDDVGLLAEAPDDSDAIEADLARMRAARDALPGPDQALLEMHFEQGLTFEAIAERLGQPAPTLRQRAKRVRDRLRAALE